MLNNVTILIPTHDRHNYLERCVAWFQSLPCKIIIADSTPFPWRNSCLKTDGIDYLHCPGSFEVYASKISTALHLVTTDFVAICADDDFIFKSGLEECYNFLRNNLDYSFCQGYSYIFHNILNRLIVIPMPYDYHDVNFDSSLKRVLAVKSTVYYGLNRTKVISDAFDFINSQPLLKNSESGGLIDYSLTTIVSRSGKMKRLLVPFGFREYSTTVSVVGTRYKLIFQDSLPNFYRALKIKIGLYTVDDSMERNFSSDLAGQLNYDVQNLGSKRAIANILPKYCRAYIELLYRLFQSVRAFLRKGYLPALAVLFSNEFVTIREYIKKYKVVL